MTSNPRLLAIRKSLAECDSHFQKRMRILDWIELPARMHRWYRVPGTKISKNELRKSKRVLLLWMAVYGSGTTPEFDAKFDAAYNR